MINYGCIKKENKEEHNPNFPQSLDSPYRIIITRDSRFGKTNPLLNLIKQQNDDDCAIIVKLIYMLSIKMKENIDILLKKVKKEVLKSVKIQSGLLNTQTICKISIKTFKPIFLFRDRC